MRMSNQQFVGALQLYDCVARVFHLADLCDRCGAFGTFSYGISWLRCAVPTLAGNCSMGMVSLRMVVEQEQVKGLWLKWSKEWALAAGMVY